MLSFNHLKFTSFLQRNKSFFIFILLMSVFRSAVADWYSVPTGSMQPTIKIGDRVVVDKMAYNLRLPFTKLNLASLNTPARGDIIVFDSEAAKQRLIKRVIGLPGDTISMKEDIVFVNGKPLNYYPLSSKTQGNSSLASNLETLGEITHSININTNANQRLRGFAAVKVPAGHYLVLGDNRRNSADSRVHGFIPHKELLGKATSIAFSVNYNNYYIPRTNRLFLDIYDI